MLLDINYNLVRIFIADAWVSVCMWVCVAFEMYVVIVWEDVGKICSNEWAECGALAINDTVQHFQRVQMRDREFRWRWIYDLDCTLKNLKFDDFSWFTIRMIPQTNPKNLRWTISKLNLFRKCIITMNHLNGNPSAQRIWFLVCY